jgi:1-acyl-sn-glycerol-3-phosphate acyltransferase
LIIWIITFLFDRRLVWLHMYTSFWASLYIWMVPAWKVSITGRKKIDSQKTYVIVSNHQSQLDILVSFGLFFPFKWVSKAEIFRVPFIGWNMMLNGYIKIKRGDKQSIRKMLEACEKSIDRGSSVFFFPEGTRSKTGQIRPFKIGAFTLAHKMKVPILAIAINGTKDALPKHSMNFHGSHHIKLNVIEEIPYSAFSNLSVDETAKMVRDCIAEHVY